MKPISNLTPPVLVVLAMTLSGCEPEQTASEPPLRAVRTLTIEQAATRRERTFSGISASALQSRLSFKVGGTVTELPIQVGDQLKAGALVARLDASPYELIAEQAQAALAQAEANSRNAAANYERVKGLYENSNASRNDLDAARASAESAEAQVGAARKALELARLDVADTALTAETDCAVATVEVEINENVASGTPVAVVSCGESLEVELDVPESLIAGIEQGMPARIRFNAVPDRQFPGVVSEVGVASTSNAATFPVTLRVVGDAQSLRPGLAAEVTFSYETDPDLSLHLLPAAAVANDQAGSFVFVVQSAGAGEALVVRRAVTLGDLTEGGVEVVSGLSAGDQVVVAGVSVIRPGQRVLLPSD